MTDYTWREVKARMESLREQLGSLRGPDDRITIYRVWARQIEEELAFTLARVEKLEAALRRIADDDSSFSQGLRRVARRALGDQT